MEYKFLILLFLAFVTSCSKSEDEKVTPASEVYTPTTGNYMDAFIMPESITLDFLEADANHPARIRTVIERDSKNGDTLLFACTSKGVHFNKYKWYAHYYGDTTYHSMHIMGCENSGCLTQLKKISIVADHDFDENHPAGSLLNDLFEISYARFYQYIQNGYKPYWLNAYALDSIAELTTVKDVNLFSEYSALIFKQQPAPGKYTFTVTLDFGEDPLSGEKVTVPPASIEIEF